METKLINIGNSKGILIPAKIPKLLGIKDKVQVAIDGKKMIIEPMASRPREKWAERFRKEGSSDEESTLLPDVFKDEDFEDWTW